MLGLRGRPVFVYNRANQDRKRNHPDHVDPSFCLVDLPSGKQRNAFDREKEEGNREPSKQAVTRSLPESGEEEAGHHVQAHRDSREEGTEHRIQATSQIKP
jgi:hypothetical protein